MDLPGKEEGVFQLTFQDKWCKGEDILLYDYEGAVSLKIMNEPTPINNKWHQKLINIITFDIFFKQGYIYGVKVLRKT